MPNNKKKLSTKRKIGSRVISWQAPGFIYYKKNISWYVILITIGIILTTAFYFINQNYLGMTVVILAVTIMIITAKQKPKTRSYQLSKKGINVNGEVYSFSEFKSFYITYIDDIENLHLERTKKLAVPISILLKNVDEKLVEAFVKQFLPENIKSAASTSDLFSKLFKF